MSMSDAGRVIAEAVEALRAFWRGRRVILVTQQVTSGTRLLVCELHACGATLAAAVTGDPAVPGALPDVPLWTLDPAAADPGDAPAAPPLHRHEFEELLHSPSPEFAAWLDGVDPDRSCIVVGTIWLEVEKLCGRPVHGWRRPEWAAWEDKTRIDALWTAIGVPAPRHTVLRPADPRLRERAAALDSGRGVVLAMDFSRGIKGAGLAPRWVRHANELDAALEEFTGRTDRVRVAEFVPGVPCSTQALLLDDGTAVFDPAEEVMLRNPATGAFFHCGTSTWWRPGPEVRAEIAPYVHRAGRYLAQRTGFRGIFTIDGLLTEDGFRATGLNPRAGGGLGVRAGLPQLPVYLFHRAVQEGVPGIADLEPEPAEEAFRDAVRRRPSYSGTVPFGPDHRPPPRGGEFTAGDGGRIRYRVEGRAADIVEIAPGPAEHQVIGPAMVEFAASVGNPGLVSFRDDSVRSTLRGGRP
jgi:hypothetical protein